MDLDDREASGGTKIVPTADEVPKGVYTGPQLHTPLGMTW